MLYPKDAILIVGQAKPGREDAIFTVHGEFYISMVLGRETGEILDVSCNTILPTTENMVKDIFIGRNFNTDLPQLEAEIRSRYFALTQKPLIACMKDAYNRYLAVRGNL